MAKKFDLLLQNGDAFVDGRLIPADIAVSGGKVSAILLRDANYEAPDAAEVYDAAGKTILPGTVDPHVHIRAPGYENREDFHSGTSAAAAGGITTILEHPIANPPQYSLEILDKRIAACDKDAFVDFAFYGAAGAQHPDKIKELVESGKIVALKTFLHEAPPGRESEFMGLTMANDAEQYAGMTTVGELGPICAVHAENNDMINAGIKACKEKGDIKGSAHARSRPPVTEYETVAKLLMFAEITGARIEFCHISTPRAMEMIVEAKKKGLDVYLETCPHYLLFDESYLDKYGAFAKCNPPLRSKEDVEGLWKYVNDGSVDFIGGDHAPYLLEEKNKGMDDIFVTPAGMPALETRLPLMLNAALEGKLTLARMVELLCANPAKVFGLYPKKGVICPGSDADFVVVDLKEETTLKMSEMYTKARETAVIFEGMKLKGKIKATIVRGKTVCENGKVDEKYCGYGQFCTPNQK